ncbi:MAG TPA: hypothetical protein VF177_14390 [Anaerolineae bacterium]
MATDWQVNGGTSHFNAWEASYFTFLEKYAGNDIKRRLLLPDDHESIFLNFLEYLRCFDKKRYLLFDVKYMSTHHITKNWHFITEEPFFFSLIKKHNLRVLNLTRKNFLRYYLSELKAQASKRWHEHDESVVGDKRRHITHNKAGVEKYERTITVDTDHLLEILELCQSENKVVEKSFAAYDRYLTFDYNDMFSHIGAPISDSILERITQWLDIDNNFRQTKPEYKKQSHLSLEKTIENYEEVAHVLQGTEFEYCLEDEKIYSSSSVDI